MPRLKDKLCYECGMWKALISSRHHGGAQPNVKHTEEENGTLN